jgi:hypothetical protein
VPGRLRTQRRSVALLWAAKVCCWLLIRVWALCTFVRREEVRQKVVFVNHADFIPQQYLPTFSSLGIECFLHRIPGTPPPHTGAAASSCAVAYCSLRLPHRCP